MMRHRKRSLLRERQQQSGEEERKGEGCVHDPF